MLSFGALVHRGAACLLGRQVGGGAEDDAHESGQIRFVQT